MSRLLWTQKQDFGPSPRQKFGMVFHAARQRVILFGGLCISCGNHMINYKDTWEWDGESWVQQEDIGPQGEIFGSAYDATRQCIVALLYESQTWEWQKGEWIQVADTGPSYGPMTYDPLRQKVVLFGGDTFRETWEWDGQEWTQKEESGPPPRIWHALTYDSLQKHVVLFGGRQPSGSPTTGLKDTWAWDGKLWRQQAEFGPSPRALHATAYDGARNCLVLFGGFDLQTSLGDTWDWDGIKWVQRQDMGPLPRFCHALAYDNLRRRMVLFGGVGSREQRQVELNDTWELAEWP